MKRSIILVAALAISLSGCFNDTFDYRDPQSLENMMSGMSLEEQGQFLKDIEITAAALGGEHQLNGYTVEDIKAEAENAREFIKNKNIKFLKELIPEMESTGKQNISLHTSSNGLLSMPIEGYIPKSYSIDILKKKLSELSPMDKPVLESTNNTQPTPTPAPATTSTQASAEQIFEEAAKQAEKEYNAKWQSIKNDPAKFLSDCKSQDMNMAIELGGANPTEAAKQAEVNCNIQLSDLKNCMDKPDANAQDCYNNIFDSGD